VDEVLAELRRRYVDKQQEVADAAEQLRRWEVYQRRSETVAKAEMRRQAALGDARWGRWSQR